MDRPDWIVETITVTSDHWYRLHVVGRNLSRGGEEFRWRCPDVADPRFDLSHAAIDPAAVPYLGRPVVAK